MTIQQLYDFGKKNLPNKDESLIFCEEFYGFSRSDIILNPLTEIGNSDIFLDAVKRRQKGEPLQYILGYWYFDNLKLTVKKSVLIPREDTLVLCDIAKEFIGEKELFGLDLCSGTGAVALSVANSCNNVQIEALELFKIPFTCLCENTQKYGNGKVIPKNLDILTSYEKYSNLDFIVSNPPYIESRELANLQIEVQNEPHTALDGGENGLLFYENICKNWSKTLKNNGLLAVEIGETQAKDVIELFRENSFINVEVQKDLNGLDRVIWGTYCK